MAAILMLCATAAFVFLAVQPIPGVWSPRVLDGPLGRHRPADAPLATVAVANSASDDPERLPDRRPGASRPARTDGAGAVSALGYSWPTTGFITQEFGCTEFELEPWNAALGCRFHYGIDIANVSGTPILAAKGGRVVDAGWREDGYGYRVVLVDEDGVQTLYAHFCCPPDVTAGQEVAHNDQIGLMGTTGASSGPHLHFAVEAGETAINPRDYLPAGGPDA